MIILLFSGITFYYMYSNFKVVQDFQSFDAAFNPSDSISNHVWNDSDIKFEGGFIKGILNDKENESLILRSLSPKSIITIKSKSKENQEFNIILENINPVNISIKSDGEYNKEIIDVNSLRLTVNLNQGEKRMINLEPDLQKEYAEIVILGDNRNGYQTFSEIIDQINSLNPVFVINNSDLVYGGKPNKYRLFYETISQLRVPMYTTLGNHDIRENGREIYTKIFGPPNYSFDYKDNHFIFLDSSRGWAEKTAISEQQYEWLENDLKSVEKTGMRIFVISHIPPTDPRDNVEKNVLPDEPGIRKTSYYEELMNNYSEYKSKEHGFPDPEGAVKFEKLMLKYGVDTVFLSHIHSYYNYVKDGVNYVISGGAGAELLTTDSYYHYLTIKITDKDKYIEMIQLPSPANNLTDRYIYVIKLFSSALWKEYKLRILLIGMAILLIVVWLLASTYYRWSRVLKSLINWLYGIIKYGIKSFKDIRKIK